LVYRIVEVFWFQFHLISFILFFSCKPTVYIRLVTTFLSFDIFYWVFGACFQCNFYFLSHDFNSACQLGLVFSEIFTVYKSLYIELSFLYFL
jgi:hypothetical protein